MLLGRIKAKWQAAFQRIGMARVFMRNMSDCAFMFVSRPDAHHIRKTIPDFPALFQAWNHGYVEFNVGDMARLYLIYLNVQQILREGIPGDFVELGVFRGNSAKVLAMLARPHARRLMLFDTFEGFDSRNITGVDKDVPRFFADTSLEYVRDFVGTENTAYVKGFFPESAATVTLPDRIALAHIDCDLYEPMRDGLRIFYPLMSPGGLMLLHDYGSGMWPGATRAIDEFFADKPEKPIIMPDKSGTAVIRRMS